MKMDYITFINRIIQDNSIASPVQFLVSGKDLFVRNAVFFDIVKRCKKNNDTIIVIDDANFMRELDLNILTICGYKIRNGMSGDYCIYNPFKLDTMKEICRIRQLLTILEYDEKRKGKLLSYLSFICHMECIQNSIPNFDLTLEKIMKYCTVLAVEGHLQNLVNTDIIDEKQHMALLTKYSECCSAAADFEDCLLILMPFIRGKSIVFTTELPELIVFSTGEFGEDEVIRSLAMQLIQFGLEESNSRNLTLIVFDKGFGNRKCVFNLLKSLPQQINTHIFSDDIFTLCDSTSLATLFNRFTARVYSRHLAMESCQEIEKQCGEIDITKTSYNVTYDRRWKANCPWDILRGKNKTESYTQMAPVREPRYRKEMIMNFTPGNGIVQYMGYTSLFTIYR